jgi:hypothetical protein
MKKPYYLVSAVDKQQGIIFVEPTVDSRDIDLGRIFRQIESEHYKPNHMKPWRVIYKNMFGVDYEVKLDHSRWPRSYAQWDRRYNPDVKTEKWHGHMWDTLKGVIE